MSSSPPQADITSPDGPDAVRGSGSRHTAGVMTTGDSSLDAKISALDGGLRELGSVGDRATRVRHLPDESGIHELPSLEGAVLLFTLGVGAETIRLSLGTLPDPAGGPKASESLQGVRKCSHGTVYAASCCWAVATAGT